MTVDWVGVSDHAYDQWRKRSPDGTRIGPRIAWGEALLVPDNIWKSEIGRCKELWFHPETEMLLIVDENRYPDPDDPYFIRTCYRLHDQSEWHKEIARWLQGVHDIVPDLEVAPKKQQ